MAFGSQNALSRKKTLDEYVYDNAVKLDTFVKESSTYYKETISNIKRIQDELSRLTKVLVTFAGDAQEDVTRSDTSTETPTTHNTEKTKEAIRGVLDAWVPPETADIKEAKRHRSSTSNLLNKLWNKDAANKGWTSGRNGNGIDNTPFFGKLTTSIISGISKSMSFQSKWSYVIKALLSPNGILLMYFIGKIFKKFVWDPLSEWFNKNIYEPLKPTITWLKEDGIPLLKQMIDWVVPSWNEVKDAFIDMITIFRDESSTWWDKFVVSVNFIDKLLSPITNILKASYSYFLIQYAKLIDKIPILAQYVPDVLGVVTDSINTMSDGMVKDKITEYLKTSDIGKRFSAVTTEEDAARLNEDVRTGRPLSKDDQKIVNSLLYKIKHGSEAERSKTQHEINIRDYNDFMWHAIRSKKYSTSEEVNAAARKTYQITGMIAGNRILDDLANKKFATSEEAIKYMQTLLTNYANLSRSSGKQLQVLSTLEKKLDESGLKNEQVLAELEELRKKYNNASIFNVTSTVQTSDRRKESPLTQ